MRASMQVKIRYLVVGERTVSIFAFDDRFIKSSTSVRLSATYFLAGGRARSPLVKLAEYFSEAASIFF